jgi:hypothetical protein
MRYIHNFEGEAFRPDLTRASISPLMTASEFDAGYYRGLLEKALGGGRRLFLRKSRSKGNPESCSEFYSFTGKLLSTAAMRLQMIILTQNMNLGTIATLPSLDAQSQIIPKRDQKGMQSVVNLICKQIHLACMDLDVVISQIPSISCVAAYRKVLAIWIS